MSESKSKKRIILFGAGRSSTYLIEYLLEHAQAEGWQILLADSNPEVAMSKLGGHPDGSAVACDINDADKRGELIAGSDFVISMLPAFLHILVAKDCLKYGKEMATASYLSDELKEMEEEIAAKGLVFANELGLDPGLDHMSAMKIFDEIRRKGGRITSFKSYTGGLVAPESDDNPWHYKISWNPRNVVLAGQCTSQYLEDGNVRYVPYHKLFRISEDVEVSSYGTYSMYVNRDSIKYIDLYGLEGIETMVRGTFRGENYCEAWAVLIDLGLTDNSTRMSLDKDFTLGEYTKGFLEGSGNDYKNRIESTIGRKISDRTYEQIQWLGLFSEEICSLRHPTPAEILEHVIVSKWVLKPGDKDLVIMQHEIEYILANQTQTLYSTLYHIGSDDLHTAMSELVGLPLAIYTKLRLRGQFGTPGCIIPTSEELYTPILGELEGMGIKFSESHKV